MGLSPCSFVYGVWPLVAVAPATIGSDHNACSLVGVVVSRGGSQQVVVAGGHNACNNRVSVTVSEQVVVAGGHNACKLVGDVVSVTGRCRQS